MRNSVSCGAILFTLLLFECLTLPAKAFNEYGWLGPFADRPDVTATFGYKRRLEGGGAWSASFTENGDIHNYELPFISNIGPDFSFSLGYQWK